jgi:3-methyladenine DNA glycosylase/8-oxoguanine DNA glycosylase
MARRAQGVRLARTHRVVETLVPLVLGQLVTGKESSRAFRLLVRTFSEPAPGPFLELRLPLGARELGAMPAAALPAAGASARHAVTLREVAFRARRLEEADALPHAEAERRLRAIPGIGPWTAGCALLYGMGHADAVPLGDYHLPHQVAWNLAGEPRGDDARMLELLEPYRGFRGRVVRWIERAGRRPPRRGPRFPLRPLDPEALGWLRAGR